MVEMRWVERDRSLLDFPGRGKTLKDKVKVLQYRQKLAMGACGTIPPIDAPTGWSEWMDVPTVKDE